MSTIYEKDRKINDNFRKIIENVDIIKRIPLAGSVIMNIKTKKKSKMADKLLEDGSITAIELGDYKKKIIKEKELFCNNVEELIEIIFETDDCKLVSEYKNGSLRYYIDQSGIKEYCVDMKTALELYVLINL